MVEDVVGVVRGLHVHQPFVDRVAVRLADSVGVFVATEEVDVDAFAEAAERGEEPPRPSGVPVAEVLAGPPHTIEGDRVRRVPVPGRMFWLCWKTLSGSYVVFTSTSRS